MTDARIRTAAITGARGYLGGIIRDRMKRAGWKTLDLVRSPAGNSSRRYLIDEEPDPGLLEGVDVLVHCAYDMTLRSRADIWRVNVDGTRRLLDLANRRQVGRTIVLSSMSAYAGTTQLYGLAKLEIEDEAKIHGALSIRPGLVYGPGAGGMAASLTMLTKLPVVPVVASRSLQFTVHHHDFAEAILALAEAEEIVTEPIGIANAVAVPFRQVIEGLARLAGHTCKTVPVPWQPVYFALRSCERLGLDPPFRSDSLLGLLRPAPFVPNLKELEAIGVELRRFGQPTP